MKVKELIEHLQKYDMEQDGVRIDIWTHLMRECFIEMEILETITIKI